MSRLLLVWLYLSFSGVVSPVLAQSQQPESSLTEHDKQTINAFALRRLKQLNQLLNTLVDDPLSESEVDALIQASCSGQSRLFDTAETVLEDDIDPAHTSIDKTEDLQVNEYLTNLILYYTKRRSQINQSTIVFSDMKSTPVQQAGDSIFIRVFFKSYFKGEYKPNALSYLPHARVVEMRAEKQSDNWAVYITRLGFVQSGEGMDVLDTSRPEEPDKPITSTHPSVSKPERSLARPTVHPPAVQVKPDSPPAKVVTSSMPTELPNSKKVKSSHSLPDSLKKPKP
ncbi:hypothetical protein [Spirosoma telluris]